MSIRFADDDIRATGRNTQGVRGIRLDEGDEVIGMAPIDTSKTLLVVSEKGFGKRTELDEYRVQSRGGKGLITYRPSEKTGLLAGIALVDDECDVIMINDAGVIIRLPAAEIPILSRITQGVTLMRTRDDKVVDIAVVFHEDETDGDAEDQDDDMETFDSPETEQPDRDTPEDQ